MTLTNLLHQLIDSALFQLKGTNGGCKTGHFNWTPGLPGVQSIGPDVSQVDSDVVKNK